MRGLVAMLVLLTAACSSASGPPATELTLSEFTIAADGAILEPGHSVLSVTNDGEFGHSVLVTDATGSVVTAAGLVEPGETTTLAVDLLPGRYEFTCRIVFQTDEGDLIDHYEEGMRISLDVQS